MDVLRNLLWLKVRLVGRAWQSRQGTTMAVVGIMGAGFVMSCVSLLLLLGIVYLGPDLGRVLMAMVLGSLYTGWILGPAFGYRFNEGIDPTVLAHLPVSNSGVILGLFLGNFLDPIVLVTIPILTACGVAGWWLGGSALAALAGLLLFLFHAMGTAQVIHLWSLAFLRRRRAKEVLFVVIALMLLAAFAALEVGLLTRTSQGELRGFVELIQDWSWIERAVLLTPPGLCLEACMPKGTASVFSPWAACLLLAAVSVLSVTIAAQYTRRILSGGGAGGGGEGVSPPRPDRLYQFFYALTRSEVLAGRAAAECRLVLREPQYLLLYISYPIAYGAACIGATSAEGMGVYAKALVLGLVVLSSIFLFTGVLFNGLAVERAGLKLAYSTPIDPLVYLVGKNLGGWFLLTLSYTVVVLVASVGVKMPAELSIGFLMAGQVSILVLLGFGNLGSTLAPMPLPVHGASTRQAPTFGRIFITLVVNSIGMISGGFGASVAWSLIFASSFASGSMRPAPSLVGLGVAWTLGLYVMSTWLASEILRRRRDRLLEVLS